MPTLAEKHPHPRDKRIERINGAWYIDGNKCVEWGATRTLEPYFPNTFNADEVYGNDKKRREAAERENKRAADWGIFFSKCAENLDNELDFEPDPLFPEITSYDFPEMHIREELLAQLPSSWIPWRVEWPLFATRVSLIGVPDRVMRDMAYPNEYRFIILDYKCQKDPWAIPFCSAFKKDVSKRTACDPKQYQFPWGHAKDCGARAKGCLGFMFATKAAKCGGQMAIYRRQLLERYIFKKPVVINRMVGVFVKPGHQGLEIFDEQAIQLYDKMVDEILLSRKKPLQ